MAPDVVVPDVTAPIQIVETGAVVDATEPTPAAEPAPADVSKTPKPKPGQMRWIKK